ncbi:MAG: ORF6N domain-containing protein [Bacteroidetes bacterium]|nr:ORF6N domain-containing protein [Bacteroidota bacterium]
MRKTTQTYPVEVVERIFYVRAQKIMLDFDLAQMYGVETRVLKQAVKRNLDRFPKDFMFLLNQIEIKNMVSQNVIPSRSILGGAKPMAFTEQGVSMLSTVLQSKRAIKVNITIMRAFVQMRQLIEGNKELARKIGELEKKYDGQFKMVFDAIKTLIHQKQQPRERIGFLKDKL